MLKDGIQQISVLIKMKNKKESIAVLISDIHFNLANLELASKALTAAIKAAKNLGVPLIIAGDLLDNKAIIRAECANRILKILKEEDHPDIFVLVGNHDKINEKGEDNALDFICDLTFVIKSPFVASIFEKTVLLLPYYSNNESLRSFLLKYDMEKGRPDIVIAHQGVQSAHMGHYIQDISSLPKETFANFRVISGHYHRKQDIECGPIKKNNVGLFSYLGSPYSQSFAEANDGPKGYSILYSDGTLELVPLDIRKHVVLEITVRDINRLSFDKYFNKDDLIWLKVHGTYQELEKLNKIEIGKWIGHNNFKLEKIYPEERLELEENTSNSSSEELFDKLIDAVDESLEAKLSLKKLWREILE